MDDCNLQLSDFTICMLERAYLLPVIFQSFSVIQLTALTAFLSKLTTVWLTSYLLISYLFINSWLPLWSMNMDVTFDTCFLSIFFALPQSSRGSKMTEIYRWAVDRTVVNFDRNAVRAVNWMTEKWLKNDWKMTGQRTGKFTLTSRLWDLTFVEFAVMHGWFWGTRES